MLRCPKDGVHLLVFSVDGQEGNMFGFGGRRVSV